ncbi:MAG: RNA degradosome polyphosphate kinase, partial [Alphaproteobacteria bacterium]|nr:RNA degradosome polyphosphate kinase [Alphaproteobacteria bacterium]
MASAERFINRELSWLAFNGRVLEEATNPRHPLLERVRFLSISASNLDEFYSVRVAGLKGQVAAGVNDPGMDGRTPAQQLAAINAMADRLMGQQQATWIALRDELKANGITVLGPSDLAEEDRRWIAAHFVDALFPVLTPIAIDPAHPFPFIPNLGMAMAFQLEHVERKQHHQALVFVPQQLDRFIRLPGRDIRFVLIDDVISMQLDRLFPGFVVRGRGAFRLVRDTEIEIEEESEDLVRVFESALKRRRLGDVIRLKIDADTPDSLKTFVRDQLQAHPDDVFLVHGLIGLVDTKQLIVDDRPELKFPPFPIRFPERIRDFGGDCFAAIRA